MLSVLAVVLIYGVFDFVKNKDQYLAFYSKGTKKVVRSGKHVNATTGQNEKLQMKEYDKPWGNDPFYVDRKVRPVAETAAEVPLILNAISYNNGNSVVMINQKILSAGDVIEGYKVIRIEPARVVLAKGDESKTLNLQ